MSDGDKNSEARDEWTPELQEAAEILARRSGLTVKQYMEVLMMLDGAGVSGVDHTVARILGTIPPERERELDRILLENLKKEDAEDLPPID